MNVELHTKKYVEKGSSVEIFCEHNVPQAALYKVKYPSKYELWMSWTCWAF